MSWWKIVKRALSGAGLWPFKWRSCCAYFVAAIVLVWWLWKREGKAVALSEFYNIIVPTTVALLGFYFAVFILNLVLAPFKILYEKIEVYNSTGQLQGSSKKDQVIDDMAKLVGTIEKYKRIESHHPGYAEEERIEIVELKTKYCFWFPGNMSNDAVLRRAEDVIRAMNEHGYAKANEILLESAKDLGENARS